MTTGRERCALTQRLLFLGEITRSPDRRSEVGSLTSISCHSVACRATPRPMARFRVVRCYVEPSG
jgi:hypothetical protein